MISRVGCVAVRLKLAADDKPRADETRTTIERVLLQNALDELERVIHDRVGERAIVHVHHLAFRWRLERAELDRADAAIAIGRELAAMILAELDAMPPPQRLRPIETANVVMFADADHALAAALADVAERRPAAWFHARHPDPARAWGDTIVAAPERTSVIASWLARMDATTAVAAWLADQQAVRPMPFTALALAAPPVAAAEESRDMLPSIEPIQVDLVVEPARQTATTAPAPPAVSVTLTAPESHLSLVGSIRTRVQTEFAAIFYLAGLVQQLDLGEHLWAIGVREGDILAHVVAALAGCELDDPAWQWFGGSFDGPAVLAPIDEWATAELETNVAAALRRELARMECINYAPVLPLRPLVPSDIRTADAVACCADALCRLWCARVGIAVNVDAVRAALRVRGALELEPGVLRVTLPMEAIDIAIRRAGIDLDPGHMPWLGRSVEIVYDEDHR